MTTRTLAMRSLPRSLDPLDDETLLGYLLRLAYRAGTTPADIADRTGLRTERGRITALSLSYELGVDQAKTFARMTRLTMTETRELLLASMAPRYGPLDVASTREREDLKVVTNNPWVMFHSSRYCPQCLASDDSAIQRQLGGAWRRSWRIPTSFLCLDHGRFLYSHCPACKLPAQASAAVLMIPRPSDGDLHPLQCRNMIKVRRNQPTRGIPACGHRYDTPIPPLKEPFDPPTLQVLTKVQRRLSGLLSGRCSAPPATFGWEVPPSTYFTDLWTTASLVLLGWPASRHLATTRVLAEALDVESERRKRECDKRWSRRDNYARAFTAPPTDAMTTGAVLEIAEKILAIQDEERASRQLLSLKYRSTDIRADLSHRLRTSKKTSVPFRAGFHYDHRRGVRRAEQSRAERIMAAPGMRRAESDRLPDCRCHAQV